MDRPKFSRDIARLAAEKIIDRMISDHLLDKDQRQTAIDDLVKHARYHMDGYEIAKYLDDNEGWNITFEMVEHLDSFNSYADSYLRKAQKEWADLTKQEPSLPIETRVKISSGEEGEIAGVYEHGAAQYLVKITGAQGHRIVNFEDAKPA